MFAGLTNRSIECGCVGEGLEDAVCLKASTWSWLLEGEDEDSSEVSCAGTVGVEDDAAEVSHS